MECQVCHQRSSIGYCEETSKLVCEECSTSCYKCNGLIALGGGHESPNSGHVYCSVCWEERKKRRESQKKISGNEHEPATAVASTGFEALMNDEVTPQDVAQLDALEDAEEAADEEASLLAGAWRPPPPWKLSFQTGIIGLAAIITTYIFPSLYRVPLPDRGEILTPYIILIIPILAILWGISGLMSMDYMADKTRCLVGTAMGILTIVLIVYSVTHDPYADENATLIEMQRSRDGMTRQELEVWRDNILDRHRQ